MLGIYTRDSKDAAYIKFGIGNRGGYISAIFGHSFTFAEKYGNGISVVSLGLIAAGV